MSPFDAKSLHETQQAYFQLKRENDRLVKRVAELELALSEEEEEHNHLSGCIVALKKQLEAHGKRSRKYYLSVAEVIKSGKVSIAYLQRNLKLSTNEAVLLLDEIERDGIISAPDKHTGRRNILLPPLNTGQPL